MSSDKPPFVTALPVTTFSVLCYQVVLTRVFAYVFDYHLTALAVSLAMFGLGTGAYLRFRFLKRRPQRNVVNVAHLALGASFLVLYFSLMVTHRPPLVIAVSALPFLAAGVIVSHYYDARRAERAAITYALDLSGAAVGCLASVWLLDRVGGEDTLLLLGGLGGVMAAVAGQRTGSRGMRGLAMLCVIAAVIAFASRSRLPDPLLNRHSSEVKPLPQLLREQGEVVDTAWSAVGRADLYQTPKDPAKIIFSDAKNGTLLLPNTPEGLQRHFAAVPYATASVRSALILGSGGGMEVRVARDAGVLDIEAVELNRGILRLVRTWREFGGPVYDQPGVTLFEQEGRAFVQSRQRRYDVIQMSLVLTGAAQGGTFALAEGYLYTREAFHSYLDRLEPEGALCLIDDSLERTLRNTVTAVAVLQQRSAMQASKAMEHIAVLSNPTGEPAYKHMLLISPSPLSIDRLQKLSVEIPSRSLYTRWMPGGGWRERFRFLAENGPEATVRTADFDVSPPTDDRPYFNFLAKKPADVIRILGPYLLLAVGTLGVLVAVLWLDRPRSGTGRRRSTLLASVYGIAFVLVEVGLLHKLSLAAGGPSRVLSVVLFALLLSCGAGALISARAANWIRPRLGSFAVIVAVVGGLTTLAIERWYRLEGVTSPVLRIACVLALVAPVGVCMGAPFPDLLRRHGGDDEHRIPYLWAVNGIAAVLGSALSLILMPLLGGRIVLLLGCAFYVVAWVLDRRDTTPID